MTPAVTTITVTYIGLVLVQFVLYCLVVTRLRTRVPSARFVRFSRHTPVSENFSMYGREFHDDVSAMALLRWARGTRAATLMLLPVFVGALLARD